jgi:DNA-binding NtrC family response regulator
MPKGSILVIDDEAEIREGLELLLKTEGYHVSMADTGQSGLLRLGEQPYDLLLLDVSLPDRNGIELLKDIRRQDPHLPIVLITAYGSIEMARAAFKSGAMDYITKPWSNDELLAQVAQAVESHRLREENVQLKRALKQRFNFPNIIGKSEKMLTLFDLVAQVAPSRSTVLISGESGTGKELIAKAIHSASTRADRAFVPVNTGSIPVDLLESQLFGHVKGAFTSAVASKKGLFEVADQGTIFFDEIATVSPETQAKLLRVIQEREFMRLGGTEQLKVDVRIVAASNIDLLSLVKEGRFREDLYHRLNVIPRPPRRYPDAAGAFSGAFLYGKYQAIANLHSIRHETPDGLRLAGECSRTGERGGTRRGPFDAGARRCRPAARIPAQQGNRPWRPLAAFGISSSPAG